MKASMMSATPREDAAEDVLRLSPEPFTYFDERTVHRLLTQDPRGYVNFVRRELEEIALGKATIEMPPKVIFSDVDSLGDFRVMPCVVRSRCGKVRKTVKLVGTNVTEAVVADQITVGKAFALHPLDNFVSHVFECCLLSSARTGMCAAQGLLQLGGRREHLTIIGAGRVGYYSALYAATLGGVHSISVCDRDPRRARHTAAAIAQHFPELSVSAQPRDMLRNSDVLILATTSREIVYCAADFHADLVIALGADTDTQREMDTSLAGSGRVYVDTHHSANVGDLQAWHRAGKLDLAQITDLFTLIRDGAVDDGRRRFYVSTGCALFDNITIGYLLGSA
jgi:ornithine cyclodeaminase/alanine dehydrogenase-like protein (mu-crystallin family)